MDGFEMDHVQDGVVDGSQVTWEVSAPGHLEGGIIVDVDDASMAR